MAQEPRRFSYEICRRLTCTAAPSRQPGEWILYVHQEASACLTATGDGEYSIPRMRSFSAPRWSTFPIRILSNWDEVTIRGIKGLRPQPLYSCLQPSTPSTPFKMSSPSTYDWDQAFLDFPQASTPATAGVDHNHHAENWHLQDQGHSDTHSSDPSYSPPPLSPAYPPQQASNFRTDEVAQDFHAPFGYQQEWTDGATTGVGPSQVLRAGRPSVPSSSSADPPLVVPSVAPSALSQLPRPQIPLRALTPVHSRLDFFLQPASFTPAPQAYNPPHHASSSDAGEAQGWAGRSRKRSRSDKENESDYSPPRPVKRARDDPGHDVPAVIAPQPMLAPSTSRKWLFP